MTEAEIRADERERCAQMVPTSWLDPLLTGKNGMGTPPYYCPDIERLLSALAAAIRAGGDGVATVDPVAWRVRGYNQFKTGEPRPWRYFDGAGMCGNSVCPPMARALVAANYREQLVLEEAA